MIKRPQKDVRQYCKREPRQHQLRIWRDTRDDEFSGFHLYMGTGKSKIAIDTVSYLFLNKKISAFVVVAPAGVHEDWINSNLKKDLPEQIRMIPILWTGKKTKKALAELEVGLKATNPDILKVLSINYEATRGRGFDYLNPLSKSPSALRINHII